MLLLINPFNALMLGDASYKSYYGSRFSSDCKLYILDTDDLLVEEVDIGDLEYYTSWQVGLTVSNLGISNGGLCVPSNGWEFYNSRHTEIKLLNDTIVYRNTHPDSDGWCDGIVLDCDNKSPKSVSMYSNRSYLGSIFIKNNHYDLSMEGNKSSGYTLCINDKPMLSFSQEALYMYGGIAYVFRHKGYIIVRVSLIFRSSDLIINSVVASLITDLSGCIVDLSANKLTSESKYINQSLRGKMSILFRGNY